MLYEAGPVIRYCKLFIATAEHKIIHSSSTAIPSTYSFHMARDLQKVHMYILDLRQSVDMLCTLSFMCASEGNVQTAHKMSNSAFCEYVKHDQQKFPW